MLPSVNLPNNDDADALPRLTVRELRDIRARHVPDITFERPDSVHGRCWRAVCSCGVALTPHRSYTDAGDAHDLHVGATVYDARRAKARAGLRPAVVYVAPAGTPAHRITR